MNDDDRHKRFLALYVGSQRSLRRLLRLLMRNSDSLDDLSQMVALRLWERFDSYDFSRPFDAWARGVAAKVALEWNRSERRAGPVLSPEVVSAIVEGFDRDDLRHVQPAEQLEALEACLEHLAPRARDLVEKRYFRSLPVVEIAREINKSVDMTYKLLQQTKRKLAECVRRRTAAILAQE